MCNAVTRTEPPEPARALLIDFAPCKQPWAFEAARLQVLNSSDPQRQGFHGLVSRMAQIRLARGLSSCTDLERLSRITLAWYAMVMWHLIPERRDIPGYRETMSQYIRDCAELN